jgi:NAD-dependent deacetylase
VWFSQELTDWEDQEDRPISGTGEVTGGGGKSASLCERLAGLRAAMLGSKKVVFFGGAGVSTESGIPDYRSTGGLYRQTYAYPPETLLSRSFFRDNPEQFFGFYREKVLDPALGAQPNDAHRALAQLEAAGSISAVITQNIDGLHQAAGSRHVLELHGSIHRNRCEYCGAFYRAGEVLSLLETAPLPRCTQAGCVGILAPDVVLYEDPLDHQTLEAATQALAAADMLIIGGTSLAVNPAASLVRLSTASTLVIINRQETWYDQNADILFHENIADVLGIFC